ncbi:MAG: chromosomal replication initiator protein DnaA [Deltaproteobacteria bacterium]|nr:chromosomal replication initiator protein DnaA [Deltaproteobacteria bacterium]
MTDEWLQVLDSLKELVPGHAFDSYLRDIVPSELGDSGRLILNVPDRFTVDRIERSFAPLIETEFEKIVGKPIKVAFNIDETLKRNNSSQEELPEITEESLPKTRPGPVGVNPDYTFDNFVVGPCNQVASAAAMALAERNGGLLNPLFLFGATGLGKSHLACAIAHHVNSSHKRKNKVMYISAERFVNEMVTSLRQNRIYEFKDKFRKSCDLLIVDDVQFLTGKVMTQGELFHTLDELQSAGKQVVLVSDVPPREIPDLDERLRSRLGSGLVVDLKPPGRETRKAILRHKAHREGLDVPEEIIDYIASLVATNVRDLEGALVRVVSTASFSNRKLSLKLAEDVLRDVVPAALSVSMNAITALVCRYYQLKPQVLLGKSRKRNAVLARQVAMYLSRRFSDASLNEIGQEFNRDHSTVLHSIQTINKKIQENAAFYRQIEFLASKIG